MLLSDLSTIVRNTSHTPGAGADAPTFDLTTVASAQQQRALDLARQITALSSKLHRDRRNTP